MPFLIYFIMRLLSVFQIHENAAKIKNIIMFFLSDLCNIDCLIKLYILPKLLDIKIKNLCFILFLKTIHFISYNIFLFIRNPHISIKYLFYSLRRVGDILTFLFLFYCLKKSATTTLHNMYMLCKKKGFRAI